MGITITLYDEIKSGDAQRIVTQLREDPNAEVEVRINSPGGSVAEGLAIYNALKPRKPTVFIDGVAASIASLIAMAGARVIAAQNTLIMIHDPWTDAGAGNSTVLRRTADLLDKHRDAMIGGYARTGLKRDDLVALLAAETWMTADEALQLGFIDEIVEPLRYAAHDPGCFASYHHTPQELLMSHRNARAAAEPPSKENADPANPAPPKPDDDQDSLAAFKAGLSSDPVTKAAHDAVMQALRDRNAEITMMAEPHMANARIRGLLVNALADPRDSAADFGQRVLAELGRGREPLGGHFGHSTMRDYVATPSASMYPGDVSGHRRGESDFVSAASDALVMRAGLPINKPHPGAGDIQGMGLEEIMRVCASRSGHSAGFGGANRKAMVKAAMTTSDFPAILENSLGKALRAGFEAEPATFEVWTRKVLVPDFKLQSRVILGSAPKLLQVPEGGEYTYGSLDEDKSVPYKVDKYGLIIQFTWEALVNDDLDAFLRTTQALGQAASRAEADNIYSTFAENSAAGPTMQDGTALFHATHGNLAATVGGITANALGSARVLLRRQTAVGGGVMNLTPRFLLVAPEHEQDAEALLAAAARSMSQGADNALVPAWLAKLELVVEARLPASAFYLLTAPTSVDTVERAWLEEDNGPKIEEQDSFNIDAKSYKVRHAFGARWLDWRGAVKVPIV